MPRKLKLRSKRGGATSAPPAKPSAPSAKTSEPSSGSSGMEYFFYGIMVLIIIGLIYLVTSKMDYIMCRFRGSGDMFCKAVENTNEKNERNDERRQSMK
jgi:hypothetical protein